MDAPTLANSARCYDCAIPDGMLLAALAYIIEQTLDAKAVSADPATLANNARCYDCVGTTPGMVVKALVDLNASIIAGGGGGGGGSDQIKTYVADPNAEGVVPGNQTIGAIAYPSVAGAGPTYQWNSGTLLWE